MVMSNFGGVRFFCLEVVLGIMFLYPATLWSQKYWILQFLLYVDAFQFETQKYLVVILS